MEAPSKIFNSSLLPRHCHLTLTNSKTKTKTKTTPPIFPYRYQRLSLKKISSTLNRSSHSPVSQNLNFSNPTNNLNDPFLTLSQSRYISWNPASKNGDKKGFYGGENREVMVILLGWLGSETKYLRSCAKWYNSRGVHAVTFIIDVKEFQGLDFGSLLEKRTTLFADRVASWVSSGNEIDGRERCLIFHTFSNTGWLVYGFILARFMESHDVMKNIKGCIVDSGGANPFNPQVWAVGFAAATFQKRSSSTQAKHKSEAKIQQNEYSTIEIVKLSILDLIFSIIFMLPYTNRRIKRMFDPLSNHQVCPQLYVYSRADKIIPYEFVEAFIEEQRKKGKWVRSLNFGSSPHVSHYWMFRNKYLSQVDEFLNECFDPDGLHMNDTNGLHMNVLGLNSFEIEN